VFCKILLKTLIKLFYYKVSWGKYLTRVCLISLLSRYSFNKKLRYYKGTVHSCTKNAC